MKNITKLTAFILLFTLAISSCKKDLQELIANDLMFNIDANAFLQNQVQLQFVNANNSNSTTLPKPTISISGKDANLVYDINGTKNIVVARQFASLAVSPGKPLSPSAPAVFKIEATAPGFLPFEQEIEVTHLDSLLSYTFEMVEINNPPAGIINSSASLDLSAKKAFAIGQSKAGSFSGKVQLKANTQFFNAEGTELKGIAKVDWRQFDTKNDLVVTNAEHLISNYGEKIIIDQTESEDVFLPVGFAQFNITSGTSKVSKFNQPVQMELNIANGTIDRSTDQTIQVGDELGIYHLNTQTKSWDFVNNATVSFNAGALTLIAAVEETGDFAIASPRTRDRNNAPRPCTSLLGIKFKRNNNINTLHYVEVVNTSNNQVLSSASNVQVFNNGTFNFRTRLPNANVVIKVYQYDISSNRGNVLATFGPFNSCTKSTTNRAEILIPEMNTIARFELDTYCADSKLFYYHEGRIQYKVKGTSDANYRDMGLALKSGRNSTEIIPGSGSNPPSATSSYSYLETDRLVSGTTYTFRTEISGRHKNTKKTIRYIFTRDRVYNLNSGEYVNYNGTNPVIYSAKKFERGYWIAPDQACAVFGY